MVHVWPCHFNEAINELHKRNAPTHEQLPSPKETGVPGRGTWHRGILPKDARERLAYAVQ
eukprot:366115-Chlamydomonas_euryale.AAC.3